MILEVTNLACEVPGRVLFQGLSFSVDAGQSLAVMGPSGSGKSTLLSAILGMAPAKDGVVRVSGDRISNIRPSESAQLRRTRIGVIFQDGELLPELTAAENVGVSLMMNSPDSRKNHMELAVAQLEGIEVPPHTRARNLSGGERQRTALVRALSTHPDLVIADEPTGSLDTITRDVVAELLFRTVKERNAALLVVTHDPTVAARADRRILLDKSV